MPGSSRYSNRPTSRRRRRLRLALPVAQGMGDVFRLEIEVRAEDRVAPFGEPQITLDVVGVEAADLLDHVCAVAFCARSLCVRVHLSLSGVAVFSIVL